MPSTIAASTTWPWPLTPGLEQRGEQADDEVRRPAAEVADQVGREVRPVRCPGPSRSSAPAIAM